MGRDRDADRAAVMRRITKLADAGWLCVERAAAVKHHLLPTWGRDANGTLRIWRLDCTDSAKPEHLRGRRVPLALLDCYLGRLDPQPGHTPAVISRYFTRPLLDLIDIGVYTTSMRAEITPTPRLCHLGLVATASPHTLPLTDELLIRAAHGDLSTAYGDAVIPVFPSSLGYARLARTAHVEGCHDRETSAQTSGSASCASGRSGSSTADGSAALCQHSGALTHQDANVTAMTNEPALIAWDVGSPHESTNQPSADVVSSTGEGGSSCEVSDVAVERKADAEVCVGSGFIRIGVAALLDPDVASGHLALNPLRTVPQGEWYELLALQQEHSAEQLLIWQARAARRTHPAALHDGNARAGSRGGTSRCRHRLCSPPGPAA
jgi:hypothetical protein